MGPTCSLARAASIWARSTSTHAGEPSGWAPPVSTHADGVAYTALVVGLAGGRVAARAGRPASITAAAAPMTAIGRRRLRPEIAKAPTTPKVSERQRL